MALVGYPGYDSSQHPTTTEMEVPRGKIRREENQNRRDERFWLESGAYRRLGWTELPRMDLRGVPLAVHWMGSTITDHTEFHRLLVERLPPGTQVFGFQVDVLQLAEYSCSDYYMVLWPPEGECLPSSRVDYGLQRLEIDREEFRLRIVRDTASIFVSGYRYGSSDCGRTVERMLLGFAEWADADIVMAGGAVTWIGTMEYVLLNGGIADIVCWDVVGDSWHQRVITTGEASLYK